MIYKTEHNRVLIALCSQKQYSQRGPELLPLKAQGNEMYFLCCQRSNRVRARMVFPTSDYIGSVVSLLKNLSKSLLWPDCLRQWFHKPTVTSSLSVVFAKARISGARSLLNSSFVNSPTIFSCLLLQNPFRPTDYSGIDSLLANLLLLSIFCTREMGVNVKTTCFLFCALPLPVLSTLCMLILSAKQLLQG